jgi:hypothetical protein
LLHDWMDMRIVGCLVVTVMSYYEAILAAEDAPPQAAQGVAP